MILYHIWYDLYKMYLDESKVQFTNSRLRTPVEGHRVGEDRLSAVGGSFIIELLDGRSVVFYKIPATQKQKVCQSRVLLHAWQDVSKFYSPN